MRKTNGAQYVEVIAGKKIVKSGAVGATTVEEIKWLTDTLVSEAAAWKDTGWAYLVDITQMSPVSSEASLELVNLHNRLGASGCKIMAFVDGKSIFTAVQAKVHQKQSESDIQEAHFATEEEAVKWIDTVL